MFKVALAGYTNAGQSSSLLNAAHRCGRAQLRQAVRHARLHHAQVRASRGPRDHRHRHRRIHPEASAPRWSRHSNRRSTKSRAPTLILHVIDASSDGRARRRSRPCRRGARADRSARAFRAIAAFNKMRSARRRRDAGRPVEQALSERPVRVRAHWRGHRAARGAPLPQAASAARRAKLDVLIPYQRRRSWCRWPTSAAISSLERPRGGRGRASTCCSLPLPSSAHSPPISSLKARPEQASAFRTRRAPLLRDTQSDLAQGRS